MGRTKSIVEGSCELPDNRNQMSRSTMATIENSSIPERGRTEQTYEEIGRSVSTSSTHQTPVASGKGNKSESKRMRSSSRGRSIKSSGSGALKNSRSRSRTRETSVITVRLKKTKSNIKNEDKNHPLVKTKSALNRYNRPKRVKRTSSSTSKGTFIDNSPNENDAALNPKFRRNTKTKTKGLGNRSKVLWRKEDNISNTCDDSLDPGDMTDPSEGSLNNSEPLKTASNEAETNSRPDEIQTSRSYVCDDKISSYLKGSMSMVVGKKEVAEDSQAQKSQIQQDSDLKPQSREDFHANKLELPSLMDTESASITCADESGYDTVDSEKITKKKKKQGFFKSRQKKNKAKRTNERDVSRTEKESLNEKSVEDPTDENQDPTDEDRTPNSDQNLVGDIQNVDERDDPETTSGVLVKGAYYLGEKADDFLSQALKKFPISMR